MGLFINKDKQPKVFKNQKELKTTNQEIVRYNFLTELINEQQKSNLELSKAMLELKRHYEQQDEKQSLQFSQMKAQMEDLKNSNRKRDEFESVMMERVNTLDEKNIQLQSMLEKESTLKQSIMEEINRLHESTEQIASRIEKSEATNKLLKAKQNQQYKLQKEVAEILSNTKEFQSGVLQRLDNQEAITEKISRQINHIRSILFERTNYLASKIEDGYNITSSYIYKLMSGSDQPLTFSMINYKKEEEKQK